jgi:uncharacterized protein DUF5994
MTGTTMSRSRRTPDEDVRLRLDQQPSRTTVLDGAWWPRSTDAVAELSTLLDELSGVRGRITHVLLNTTVWALPHPRRATTGQGMVRLGWFTSQPAGLVTIICDFGRDRFDLLVVPPDTRRASADAAMAAAADANDERRTPELLELTVSGSA